jgi:excisionase family DNA binding protein
MAGELWTSVDVARLRQSLAARTPDWAEAARALGRSERACRAKAQRLGLLGDEGYGQAELARLLDVSLRRLAAWRADGRLRAARSGTRYRYSRRAVRAFVRAHADQLGPRVDSRWLVDLLAGADKRTA